MSIRLATVADLDALVAMSAHFIAAIYPTDMPFNPAQVRTLAAQLIGSPDSAIYLAEKAGLVVGMLALTAYAHPMSGERIATEVCWWVEPAHRGVGVRLFDAAQTWAREQGAVVFQMIAPSPEVARFYERMGLHFIETTYQQRLT